MSTRGAIVVPDGNGGWAGRYHHWDSYPSGLGASLYALAQTQSVERLIETLITQHPAGWSTINGADWTLEPGYETDRNLQRCTTCRRPVWEHYRQYYTTKYNRRKYVPPAGEAVLVFGHSPTSDDEKPTPPQCYCHGGRHGKEWLVTQKDAAGQGVEWVYVLYSAQRMMRVLEASADGQHSVGMFGCDDPEAVWVERAVVKFDQPEPEWETLQ